MSHVAKSSDGFLSRYGGLWIDRSDSLSELARRMASGRFSAAVARDLLAFIEDGFVILRNAVPHETIDALNADISNAWSSRDRRYKVQTAHGDYKNLVDVERDQILAKLLDVYVYSEAARRTSLSPVIANFLRAAFDEEILAFQNLTFEVGSTQAVHRDGAYVVVDQPMKFAASWVAREDIREGSGELVYYPKSHRFPDFDFGPNRMHWDATKDGEPIHTHFLAYLHKCAAEKDIPLEHFLPKKGDALIWHAGLAHGGGPIADRSLSRLSYVTHYCPLSVQPNYFSFAPEHAATKDIDGTGHIASWFYPI